MRSGEFGGLRVLDQITERSRPLMYEDFCEAYNLARPVAESLAQQLAEMFGSPMLSGSKSETGRWHTPA
jgi:hypothetical protein